MEKKNTMRLFISRSVHFLLLLIFIIDRFITAMKADKKSLVSFDCLRLLEQVLGADCQQWPTGPESLGLFVRSNTKNSADCLHLSKWLEPKSKGNTSIGNSLLSYIQLHKVFRKTKDQILWKPKMIDVLLRQQKLFTNASTKVSETCDITSPSMLQKIVTNVSTKVSETSDITPSFMLLDTKEKMETAILVNLGQITDLYKSERLVVAVRCDFVQDALCLIILGTQSNVFIFDCVKLGASNVCKSLAFTFSNRSIIKIVHNVYAETTSMVKLDELNDMACVIDTQLAMESLTGTMSLSLNQMLDYLKIPQMKVEINKKLRHDRFLVRPLDNDTLREAHYQVRVLLEAKDILFPLLGDSISAIERASMCCFNEALRNEGNRSLAFDKNNSYRVVTWHLLKGLNPDSVLESKPLVVSNDTKLFLDLIPNDIVQDIESRADELFEIALDRGRTPIAWIGGERVLIGCEGRVIDESDINSIVEKLGDFGPDNRAGLENQLHRISAIRNRTYEIIGLTMRVGRHVTGNATMIADILLGKDPVSILFLGEPGSGKTTIIREATRLVAEIANTCIVDTSNEIAGDGNIPHRCVGYARRMMVRNINDQADVMVECIQNHTPEVMVIDEIGRSAEVDAARTCKQRGVRLLASAHGDFRKLIKNPKLKGMIGGIETIMLGDEQAKKESMKTGNGDVTKNKLKPQRAGEPVFDIIIELRRNAHHEWRIIMNVANAVDQVLAGSTYDVQVRIRDSKTGTFYMKMEQG